jgi:integrase/recombinase XerD
MTTMPDPAVALGISEAIQSFLSVLRRRGRSAGTIDTYWYGGLCGLERFLLADGCLEVAQLTRDRLERYQDSLLARGLKPKTRSVASSAIRAWLTWVIDEDLVPHRLLRAVEHVHVAKRLPRPIPLADLERIQAHLGPRRPGMRERELRDRALFTFLLVTACRVSEALRLRRTDLVAGAPLIALQKGGAEKELLVTPTLLERLSDYLAVRRDDEPALWVTTENGPRRPLSRPQVQAAWTRISRDVGVPRFTSHQLRHTCATELTRAGVGDLVVAHHLGHANLNMLPNYAAVVDQHREAKLRVLEGLLRLGAKMGVDNGGNDRSSFVPPVRVGGRADRRGATRQQGPSSTTRRR